MIELDDNGGFVDVAQLREAAGEGFEDSKVFDDIKDLPTLAKNYAATKSAFGKKLENVIQKPGKDAKPGEIETYRAGLASELGLAAKPEEIELKRPELPEGFPYDEVMEGEFKTYCIENKIPKKYVELISDWYNNRQSGVIKNHVEGQQKQFKDDVALIEKDWQGDTLPANLRTVFKAVQEFGSEDLKKQLNDAKLYDNPKQYDVWAKLLGGVNQLRVWQQIGSRIQGSKPLPGGGGGGGELTQRQKDMRDFPLSPNTWAKE